MTIELPLKFGLVATIVSDEVSDRLPFVPPPVPASEHALTCGCEACLRRASDRRRGVA